MIKMKAKINHKKFKIWEGVYTSFQEAPYSGDGYQGEALIKYSLKKLAALKKESAESRLLPPAGNYRECLLPLLAALVYSQKGRVRVLDFGGNIGLAYYPTFYGLPQGGDLEYHILEQEGIARAGKNFFRKAKNKPFFLGKLPQSAKSYDIVHLASTIHYIDDWKKLLSRLSRLSAEYLLLVDLPAGEIPTFVTIQNYYQSRIPVRFFNIKEIVKAVEALGFGLIFKSAYQSTIFGIQQDLPMKNFAKKYWLKQTCNLLFKK